MAHLVKIAARAERDLAALYEKIHAEQSDAALEWYRGLKDCILGLEAQPDRCPVTRKRDGLRNLLCGHKLHIYRVIYRAVHKQKQVEILHIRHGAARRKFKAPDIK
jgi:plasmid stabilization system protein ParE